MDGLTMGVNHGDINELSTSTHLEHMSIDQCCNRRVEGLECIDRRQSHLTHSMIDDPLTQEHDQRLNLWQLWHVPSLPSALRVGQVVATNPRLRDRLVRTALHE